MIDRKLDELLQEQFVHDAPSKLKYNSLTEAQKLNLTKFMVDSSMKLITKKADMCDYSIPEASRGSIRKIQGYSDLVGAIDSLKALQSLGNRNIEGLATVDAALTNLKNLEPYFVKAFATNCEMIQLIYNNVTIALIVSTAYLVATAVDYLKTDSGLVQMTANPRAAKGLDSSMLKSLSKFNKMCMNGDLVKFMNRALPELKSNFLGLGMGASIVAGIGIFGITSVAVLVSIRQIVYQYYNMRVKVSDYLRINATFTEMNQNKLAMANNMQSVAKKQQEIAGKLIKMADKIDIDQKASTKKTTLELRDDLSAAGGLDTVADNDDLLF